MSVDSPTAPTVIKPVSKEILHALKETISQYNRHPTFLLSAELQFYYEWLKSMGAKLDDKSFSSMNPMQQEQLSDEIMFVLKETSLLYDLNPELLDLPELQFYREWLELDVTQEKLCEKTKTDLSKFLDEELSEFDKKEISLMVQKGGNKIKKHAWFDWDCRNIYVPFFKQYIQLLRDEKVTEQELLGSSKYERLVTEYHNKYTVLTNDNDYKSIHDVLEEKVKSTFSDAFRCRDGPDWQQSLREQVDCVAKKLLAASKAVVRVSITDNDGNERGGTGVLSVLADKSTVVITNNHVVEDEQDAQKVEVVIEEGNQKHRIHTNGLIMASSRQTLEKDSEPDTMDVSLLQLDEKSRNAIQEAQIKTLNVQMEADMLHGQLCNDETLKECEQYLLPQKTFEIVCELKKLMVGSSGAGSNSPLQAAADKFLNVQMNGNQYTNTAFLNEIEGDVSGIESIGPRQDCPWLIQTRQLFVEFLSLLNQYLNQQHMNCPFREYCNVTKVIQWLQVILSITLHSARITLYSESLNLDLAENGNEVDNYLSKIFRSVIQLPVLLTIEKYDVLLGELINYACAVHSEINQFCIYIAKYRTNRIRLPCCNELLDVFEALDLDMHSFILDLAFSSLIHQLMLNVWVTTYAAYGRNEKNALVAGNFLWFDLRLKQFLGLILSTVPVIASFWLHSKARVQDLFAEQRRESNSDTESKIITDFKLQLRSVMQRLVVIVGHPHLSSKRLSVGNLTALLANNMDYSCATCGGSSGSAVFNVQFCFPNRLLFYLAGIHVKNNIGLGLSALQANLVQFNDDDLEQVKKERWIETTLESLLQDIKQSMSDVNSAARYHILSRIAQPLTLLLHTVPTTAKPAILAKKENFNKLLQIAMLTHKCLVEKIKTHEQAGNFATTTILTEFVALIAFLSEHNGEEMLRNGGEQLLDFLCSLLALKPDSFPEIFRIFPAILIAELLSIVKIEDDSTTDNPEQSSAYACNISVEYKTKLENYLKETVTKWKLDVNMTLSQVPFLVKSMLEEILQRRSPVTQNLYLWRLAWSVKNKQIECIPTLKNLKATGKLQQLLNAEPEQSMTTHGRKLTEIIIEEIKNYP